MSGERFPVMRLSESDRSFLESLVMALEEHPPVTLEEHPPATLEEHTPVTIKHAEKISDEGQRGMVVALIREASKHCKRDLSRHTATLSSDPFRRDDVGKYVTAVVQTESDKINNKGSDYRVYYRVYYDVTGTGHPIIRGTILRLPRDLTDEEKREFSEVLDGNQEPEHKETE
ncbi:uncharacterized protein BKA78DRAFT_181736 [Phyllosticta capitalensis]|uniref:uncharacterized protein n=1 Tax=Phyllosticta capitalensis TaxID=121624 RepID=UPI00312E3BCD